jgi:MoaA/NifB/PqqE/SkfB family radical SAM enzyme
MSDTIAPRAASAVDLTFLWLEITGKCNLACSHCYADSGPMGSMHGEMGREDWIRVIAEAAELDCRELQFIGGEPTMHPDLRSLIREARQQGFMSIEVFTNATRLGRGLVHCLQEYGVDVASSFYSDDPYTHGRITGSPESWHRTVEGFQAVLAAGLSLRVGVIEMDENAGQVVRTKAFLNSLGIKKVRADRLSCVGLGELRMIGKAAGPFDELCGQCWNGRLCVTLSGTVYPCVFARAFPMGDARTGLGSILSSKRLTLFRSQLRQVQENLRSGDCNPDCEPNSDCSPHYCNPDFCCEPNEPSECGPDK